MIALTFVYHILFVSENIVNHPAKSDDFRSNPDELLSKRGSMTSGKRDLRTVAYGATFFTRVYYALG